MRYLFLMLMLSCLLGFAWPADANGGGFIQVARDGFTFTDGEGELFLPMGAYYFYPRHHRVNAMDWWHAFHEPDHDAHFALAKELGCNTLRLIFHLHATSEEGAPPAVGSAEDWRKCDTLVRLARKHGLRLYVELALPGYLVQESKHRPYYEAAYRALGERYRDEPAILCWGLDPEGVALVGYEGDKELWLQWLAEQYDTPEANAAAWGLDPATPGWREAVWTRYRNALHHSGEYDPLRDTDPALWYLDELNSANGQALYDWQRFRAWLYARKLRPLAEAIRAAAPNHLVTVDLLIYAFPLFRNPGAAGYGGPYGWPGVDMEAMAGLVDFIGLHAYPVYIPPRTAEWYEGLMRDPALFERQLRFLETAARFVHVNSGLPVVNSETGWHGGAGDWQGNTEADQKRWNLALIRNTRDCMIGWINWTLMDVPTHESITQTSGLVTAGIATQPDVEDVNPLSGVLYKEPLPPGAAYRVKAWGKVFAEAVREVHASRPRYEPGRRVELSRRFLYTADVDQLDRVLQTLLSDPYFPSDVFVVDEDGMEDELLQANQPE